MCGVSLTAPPLVVPNTISGLAPACQALLIAVEWMAWEVMSCW